MRTIRRVGKIIHPVFAANPLRHYGARLRPAHVPSPLVSRQHHTLALPVQEIPGYSQAELRVFGVVTRVSEVERAVNLNQPRIFHPAASLIVSLWYQDRLGAPGEVHAVGAGCVAEPGGPVPVLGAIKHNDLAIFCDHGGVKDACRFEPVATRAKDRIRRKTAPLAEREESAAICSGRGWAPLPR